HPNRALVFASTSKITFPGAGVAVFGSSSANVRWFAAHDGVRAIGPDKINQLRHIAALPDMAALLSLMDEHRRLLAPKFDAVGAVLTRILVDAGIARWTQPHGGYFISLYTPDGCARRTIELAGAAGVTLTPAGAAFPYYNDPRDHHIRIAPTSLSLGEVKQ